MGREFLGQARAYQNMEIEQLVELFKPRHESGSYAKWVWHYTTAAGVEGIFRTRRCWASHVGEMNDAGEGTYGREVIVKAFKRLENEGLYARDDADPAWKATFHTLGQILQAGWTTQSVDYYLLCGSADFDALNQWQHYGSGGFAVGVPTAYPLSVRAWKDPTEPLARKMSARPLEWRRVLYDEEVQVAYAAGRIMIFVESLRFDQPHYLSSEGQDRATNIVEDFFWPTIGLMKHPRFKAEAECRVIFPGRDVQWEAERGEIRVAGEQFRRYQLVGGLAQVDAAAVVANLPLGELRLGPTPMGLRERRLASTRRMLTFFGFDSSDHVPNTATELVESSDEQAVVIDNKTIGLSYSDIPYVSELS